MATLLSITTGNFTSSSTWGLVDPTSEVDALSGAVFITTGNSDSGTFTPGAITIAGIAVRVYGKAAGVVTGTLTLTLRNSTDNTNVTSVTVNNSDFHASMDSPGGGGWCYFKFSSSQTLIAAKAYLLRFTSSVNSQIALYASSRLLVTTTTQAPVANDKCIILGSRTAAATFTAVTVTMDNTATTSFGPTVSGGPPDGMSVSDLGTLTYGATASTNYYLKLKGYLRIYAGGIMNIGTSGTPMPSTSTAVLEFAPVAATDSGLDISYGEFNAYGNPIIVRANLAADAAVSATSITTDVSTGWLTGDVIVIAPTSNSASEVDVKTLASGASGTSIPVSALTYAHKGTSPLIAEVINLTRNVIIRSSNTSFPLGTYVQVKGSYTARYVSYDYMGYSDGSANAIYVLAASASTPNIVDVQYCSFQHVGLSNNANAFYFSGGGTITFSHNVAYTLTSARFISTVSISTLTGTTILDDNVSIHGGMFTLGNMNLTFTNNVVAASLEEGFQFNTNTPFTDVFVGSGNVAHSNSTYGFRTLGQLPTNGAMSNSKSWRNQIGLFLNANTIGKFIFDGFTLFGNYNQGAIYIGSSVLGGMVFKDFIVAGDSTYATSHGLRNESSGLLFQAHLENCDFGTVSGIYRAMTTADLYNAANSPSQITANNLILASATKFTNYTGASAHPVCFVKIEKYQGTAGNHLAMYWWGTVSLDSVIYKTAAPSERLTPSNARLKLFSGPKGAAVASGSALTFSVWVRKSTSSDAGGANYAGNNPRLILSANAAVGVTADTVLDTNTASVGTWQHLTGTTPTATDDGVMEVYVDCDGTAGWVNVDDYTVS